MGPLPQPVPPNLCQQCGADGAADSGRGSVERRGRVTDRGAFCPDCWERHANEAARQDGVIDPQVFEPDPDDVTHYEPVPCPRCNAPLNLFLTDYDRWVALEHEELPAGSVPDPHRWRLCSAPGYLIAVRVTGDEPSPVPLVQPTHRYRCFGADNSFAIPYQELRARKRGSGPGEQ